MITECNATGSDFSETISIKFILSHVNVELLQSLWNEMIHT